MIGIKRCPFCECTALTIENESNLDYRVVCADGHKSAWCPTLEAAVANWNNRPGEKALVKRAFMACLRRTEGTWIHDTLNEFLKAEGLE